MMPSFVNHNGQLVSNEELLLASNNRAFYYGDGFFETIRMINGKPVHLEDHIDRMNRSYQFLQLVPPFNTDIDTLTGLLMELASANGVKSGGRARITFYRSSGGFYTPHTDHCNFLAECKALTNPLFDFNRTGIHLALYTQNLKPVQPLYTLKSLNSLIYVLAGIHARNQHCDDSLIMNDYENIIESTHSNLFIVRNGTIITPGLDEGCIPGVMRKNILKIIENKTEYSLERGIIRQKDLMEADEVFLTNSIRGIQWVVGFKEKRYYHKVSASLSDLLNQQFS
jgi:branched-subunit amino acid aminotransferase/4-amino-4-deoxychorismate lyase